MPVYEYRCKTCGKTHEIEHGFNDERPTVCPECGGTLARVFHPVGVVFKGSGFHKNDYSKSGARSGGSGDSSQAPTAASGDSSAGGKGADTAASGQKPAEGKPAESKSSSPKPTDGKPSGGKSSDAKSSPSGSSSASAGGKEKG